MADLVEFTGDLASAAVLRRSLLSLAAEAHDPAFADQVRAVAAGGSDIHELLDHPEMKVVIDRGLAEYDRVWAELSPEEREHEIAAGRRYLGDEVAQGRSARPAGDSP